ncbi:hypothetical protein CYMTET_41544 [Cymbomonas tetramitiformis]|uniref:Band 7 domain-containing protein n=1 Tax=Cymbomonas tetramitiformis TaxID=36881 RepID=A0AAE0C5W8_9CHLO|nr:hypothetical protein CYMTET_41544 [Cymbomonas tetramitiformis]
MRAFNSSSPKGLGFAPGKLSSLSCRVQPLSSDYSCLTGSSRALQRRSKASRRGLITVNSLFEDFDSDDDGPRLSQIAPLVPFFAAVFLIIGKPFTSVPAGNVAAVDLFGTVQEYTIPEGVHPKTPFASTHNYSLKTQLVEVTQDVATSEGLIVELDVSILYKVQPGAVRSLYQNVGVDYDKVLVLPEVKSIIRNLTSQYSAKTLYSAGRSDLSQGIINELNRKLNPRGIVVEDALLRKVVLPDIVTRAIEGKLRAEQESQQMEFILVKEKQEAERKRVEAQGIADFQAIVSEGINDQLLEWKGIEATEQLAQSPNTKVIVVGNAKNGLPLILVHKLLASTDDHADMTRSVSKEVTIRSRLRTRAQGDAPPGVCTFSWHVPALKPRC